MASYKLKTNIIEDIMTFIATCPFLDEYHIDLTPATIGGMATTVPDGSSLDYVGSVMVDDKKDVNGSRYVVRKANFLLWLLRKSNHELYRREVANFLFNFEQWVEYCQFIGLTPKISNCLDGKVIEVMSADNGAYIAEWEGTESSLYMVQIHIVYYNDYLNY